MTDLDSYMRARELTDADFAQLINRDRSMVNKLRRGRLRPTLETAGAIEIATDGAVSMRSWLPDPDEPQLPFGAGVPA